MGSKKLDLRTPLRSRNKSIDRFYDAAFGPSVALYKQISLCGWRMLINQPEWPTSPNFVSAKSAITFRNDSDIEVLETSKGMTIKVALCNIKEESLHLMITGKMVIIRGERIVPSRRIPAPSFSAGRFPLFQHQIMLPATVRTRGFRAQMIDGIVQIDFARRKD